MRTIFCVWTLGFLLLCVGQSDATESLRAKEKKQVEAARLELQQKLKALKKDITKTESAKERASDALEDSEQAISVASRSLRDSQLEQKIVEARLNELIAEQIRLSAQVEKQKTQLSDFLRRQYMHGDNDRTKLLLSGDNPNRINRDLQYMSYISQTQAKLIGELRLSLEEVEKNRQITQQTKDALDEIVDEQRGHKKSLEKERKHRADLLTSLAAKLKTQRNEAENLRKDEQRLSSLVFRLNKLMEEQAKAEQARIVLEEKQRKEKLAREKNQAVSSNKKLVKESDEQKRIIIDQTPIAAQHGGEEFSRLKGQLYLPVKGELIAKFGKKRGDGPTWKGLFIKAIEGAEIKAIAAGKVVIVEWMRGFGNMIILDHGGQYLSIYSNNQAVLKHVGDTVKAGDVIASAGNSGGNEESGLYFEMRYRGQVFDPMSWVHK